MAAYHNLVIDQGSDYNLKFTLKQNNINLTTLTGYSIRSQIRQTKTATTVTASFTGTVVDDAQGIFLISLPAVTSASITAGEYYYDVELYKDTLVTRILEGKIRITQEVTR